MRGARRILPVVLILVLGFNLVLPASAEACSRCECGLQDCYCTYSLFFRCILGFDWCADYSCPYGQELFPGARSEGQCRVATVVGPPHKSERVAAAGQAPQVVRVAQLAPRT